MHHRATLAGPINREVGDVISGPERSASGGHGGEEPLRDEEDAFPARLVQNAPPQASRRGARLPATSSAQQLLSRSM